MYKKRVFKICIILVALLFILVFILGICFFAAVKSGLISKWQNSPAEGTQILKVFFNNSNLDPEASCNKVFPVEREVEKTQTPARKALEMLLLGPTESEKENGYFTSINPGVKIQSLVIENGIAKVDFDEALEFRVGGSCRVSAIRAEITQTLKQFLTVSSVIISINGRTEDILQP
jgi:spore germination protein GerM